MGNLLTDGVDEVKTLVNKIMKEKGVNAEEAISILVDIVMNKTNKM